MECVNKQIFNELPETWRRLVTNPQSPSLETSPPVSPAQQSPIARDSIVYQQFMNSRGKKKPSDPPGHEIGFIAYATVEVFHFEANLISHTFCSIFRRLFCYNFNPIPILSHHDHSRNVLTPSETEGFADIQPKNLNNIAERHMRIFLNKPKTFQITFMLSANLCCTIKYDNLKREKH